jgi:hypothetical protein
VQGRIILTLACVLAAAGASARISNVTDPDAPRSLPAQGPVSVQWEDPAQFSEIRYSHNPSESRRGHWVEQLARYLREQAQARLPVGERLEVVITDINLQDTRIIRELYPPRIELRFRRLDAAGGVIAEGERKLTNGAFLHTSRPDSDALRYEEDLIDTWVRRELPAPVRAGS